MKTSIILVSILFSFFVLKTNYTFADNDPANDTREGAEAISLNSSVTGTVDYTTDRFDYYKFTNEEDGYFIYTITVENGGIWFNGVLVYAPNGEVTSIGGVSHGTWYVEILCNDNNVKYSFTATLQTISEKNDLEPNDDFSNAIFFPLNSTASGHIGFQYGEGTSEENVYDFHDWYKLEIPEVGSMEVKCKMSINPYSVDNINSITISLFNSDGITWLAGDWFNNYGEDINFTLQNLKPGIYYLRIFGVIGNGYTLSNSFKSSKLSVANIQATKTNSFSDPAIFYQGKPSQVISSPIKICADGSSSTQIELYNEDGFQNSDILFKINTDEIFYDEALNGSFLPVTKSSDSKTFTTIYHHPRYVVLNDEIPFRHDTILAVLASYPDRVIFKIPIQIYRAPVLLIHGFWSSKSSFDEMEQTLIHDNLYPKSLIVKVDYSYFSTCSMDNVFNENVISGNIYALLARLRYKEKISAGKVDLVGHSLGGLLARQYIQSDVYESDVNKLITLNTPSSGSQLANYILSTEGCISEVTSLIDAIINNTSLKRECAVIKGGAINDLKVNSDKLIQDLNNPNNLNKNIVPSFCVTTEGTAFKSWLYGLILSSLKCHPESGFLEYLFYNEKNDGVVTLSSQQGGLISNYTSHWTQQSHAGSQANSLVIDNVENLLKLDPLYQDAFGRGYFSLTGFKPDLNTQTHYLRSGNQNSGIVSLDSTAIKIVYPKTGAYFNAGEIVPVSVSSSLPIDNILFQAYDQFSNQTVIDTILNSGIINYKIPLEAHGLIGLLVLGSNTQSGLIGYDTVYININRNYSLDSITYYPDTLYIQANQTMSINIDGYFNNGAVYDISNEKETNYSIQDSSIAKHFVSNSFTGYKVGTTNCLVSYMGKTISFPIKVGLSEIEDSIVLSSNLISFMGSAQTKYNYLEWQVITDNNFSHFVLQRKSDSTNWISITEVKGASTQQSFKYSFKDSSASNIKQAFYKLLLFDKNGIIQSSQIIVIKRNYSDHYKIFPNPVSNKEIILITSSNLINPKISIIDLSGKTVKIFKTNLIQENVTFRMDLNGLRPSTYFLKIQADNENKTFKIMVLE